MIVKDTYRTVVFKRFLPHVQHEDQLCDHVLDTAKIAYPFIDSICYVHEGYSYYLAFDTNMIAN